MTVNPRATLVLALALLLATGCNRQPAEAGQAAGEVLEGTVSDAMIATEQTRSQAPLAPRSTMDEGKPGKKQGKAGAEEEEGNKSAPAPEPGTAAPAEAPATPAAPAGDAFQ